MSRLLQRTAAAIADPTVSRETPAFHWIDLAAIRDNPWQTRITEDPNHILNLAASIVNLREQIPDTLGLQQVPLARLVVVEDGVTRPLPAATYRAAEFVQDALDAGAVAELMFGHSRYRAWRCIDGGSRVLFPDLADADRPDAWQKLVGTNVTNRYSRMPLRLAYASDYDMARHAVAENRQRKDLSAIEEARAMQRQKDEFNLTDDQLGALWGYSRTAIVNKRRLLDLPDQVQGQILKGELSETHGRLLLPLADAPERLLSLANQASTLSTRELEVEANRERKVADAEREKERQIAAVRAAHPALSITDARNMSISAFAAGSYWADASLLDGGHCGLHCPCFAARYNEDRPGSSVRLPCPDTAPNVAYICTNDKVAREKMDAIQRAKEADAAADKEEVERQIAQRQAEAEARRQRAEEIGIEAERLIADFLAATDLAALWSSAKLWKGVFDGKSGGWTVYGRMASAIKDHKGIEEIQRAIIAAHLRGDAHWNSDVGASVLDLDKIKARIKALGGKPAPKRPQPAPGDSQTTGWQDGWDDEDDEEYESIIWDTENGEWTGPGDRSFYGDGTPQAHRVTRPLVALRLIEETEDKIVRGHLWRRYNELTGDNP